MAKKEVLERVANLLEETWNPTEFAEFFMQNNENKLAEMVLEKLREEGFPKTANYINTDFTLYCTNRKSYLEWAEIATEVYINDSEGSNENENIRNFFSKNEDMYMYMSNLEGIEFTIKFKLTPEEYVELYPTIEKIAKNLEEKWDDKILVKKMQELDYEPLEEMLRDKLSEAGFKESDKVDLDKIKYRVTVKNKLDYTSWAEIAIEKYLYGSLKRFLQTEMYYMYLDHPNHLEMDADIETLPEEWNEMSV